PVWHVVRLAVPRSVVAVFLKHLTHAARALRDEGVVTWVAGCHLCDDPACHRVMIATCDERGTTRRAKCRGVERVVTESIVSEPVKAGSVDRTAKCTARPEANIIHQDQENIRSTFGSFDFLREVRS